LKFSYPDCKLEITVFQENPENFRISIKDHGVGMEKDELDHLFDVDRKHTTKGTLGEKGTGLGISIVKSFVEQHGGSISATSEFGNRTTFTLSFIIATDSEMNKRLASLQY